MGRHSHEARKALSFANQHDWGKHARLSGDGSKIRNLEDVIMHDDDRVTVETVELPATLAAVREFGGY